MCVSKQVTVRLNLSAKRKLDEIQARTDLSKCSLLERAINLLDMDLRAQQFSSDLADLVNNPDSLSQYMAISHVIDGTSNDVA